MAWDRDAARLGNKSYAHAVALRPPQVLRGNGARCAGQSSVDLRPADQEANQAAIQGRNRQGVFEPRAAIRDAQFEGRVADRRTQRPPQEAGVLDRLAPHHGLDEALVLSKILEQVRETGAGHLAPNGQAIGREARLPPLPERRGRRKGQEQWRVRQHPVHQIDPLIGLWNLDMDVHAAHDIAASMGRTGVSAMSIPITLRTDFDAAAVRRAAKATRNAAQGRRLLALAEIYDGGTRTDAARIGGVGLQTVRDWVLAFNAGRPRGADRRQGARQSF